MHAGAIMSHLAHLTVLAVRSQSPRAQSPRFREVVRSHGANVGCDRDLEACDIAVDGLLMLWQSRDRLEIVRRLERELIEVAPGFTTSACFHHFVLYDFVILFAAWDLLSLRGCAGTQHLTYTSGTT